MGQRKCLEPCAAKPTWIGLNKKPRTCDDCGILIIVRDMCITFNTLTSVRAGRFRNINTFLHARPNLCDVVCHERQHPALMQENINKEQFKNTETLKPTKTNQITLNTPMTYCLNEHVEIKWEWLNHVNENYHESGQKKTTSTAMHGTI